MPAFLPACSPTYPPTHPPTYWDMKPYILVEIYQCFENLGSSESRWGLQVPPKWWLISTMLHGIT